MISYLKLNLGTVKYIYILINYNTDQSESNVIKNSITLLFPVYLLSLHTIGCSNKPDQTPTHTILIDKF